jgi:hypothetical protein
MLMKLRAWWYLRFAPTVPLGNGTGKRMPLEVREYIMRNSIKQALAETDEEKKKFFCTLFWQQAMSGQVSAQMSDELIAATFKLTPSDNRPPLPPTAIII